ncbi:MAG: MazG-like family protein [Aeromonadaceae bacterium]
MMNMFNDIRQWAHDRNLIEGSDRFRQMVKLVEEQGELAAGIAKGREDLVKDAIGDMVVVLTILAEQSDITIESCIRCAWKEIKDRKGRMIDGVFVKSDDL